MTTRREQARACLEAAIYDAGRTIRYAEFWNKLAADSDRPRLPIEPARLLREQLLCERDELLRCEPRLME